MSSDALHAVTHYGYWVILAGALLEGETVLLAAGYAAHQGLLSWPWVIATAALGGALGDQVAFFIGRWRGQDLISRFPWVAQRIPAVHRMLEQHERLAIIGVRFLYGFRIAGPIILGTSHISLGHFARFNALGALIWAFLVSGSGYYFSGMVASIDPDQYPSVRFLISLLLVLVIGRVLWIFSKK